MQFLLFSNYMYAALKLFQKLLFIKVQIFTTSDVALLLSYHLTVHLNFCGIFKERGCKIFKEIRGGERHRLSKVPLFSSSLLSFRRSICAILYFSSRGKNI